MLQSLSSEFYQTQKKLSRQNASTSFRSHSHDESSHINHQYVNTSQSVDIFNLTVPISTESSLSSLICSICSLPMMKPILLPCQHAFCFRCIKHNLQIRSGSLPVYRNDSFESNKAHSQIINCQKCSHIHHVNSIHDLKVDTSVELLINTLLCEKCHRLNLPNQIDTCLYCYGVLCLNCHDEHVKNHKINQTINENNSQIPIKDVPIDAIPHSNQPKPSNTIEKKALNKLNNQSTEEDQQEMETNNSKKKPANFLRRIMSPSRSRRSASISVKHDPTNSPTTPIRRNISLRVTRLANLPTDTTIEGISPIQPANSTTPVTPIRKFLHLFDQYTQTDQQIKQFKKRQSELDRVVDKLIQVLTIKTNENINRIILYWMHLKQMILEKIHPKTNSLHILDYIFNSCCSNTNSQKQIELHFHRNDEIKASLEVLSATLTIVKKKQTVATVSHLFDKEEQTTVLHLKRRCQLLLEKYNDEKTNINERINVHEFRFASWKNSNTKDLNSIILEWKQTIENDYPTLIERISNDFITKVPHVESVLVEMLQNMKTRLVNIESHLMDKRTEIS